MRNFFRVFIAGLCIPMGVWAQAYPTQTGKGATLQGAAAVRLSFDADRVEQALKAYLSQKGYGSSKAHGYLLSRGVALGEGDNEGSDLYFQLSTPDRKMKDNTVLTLVPAKKNQPIGGGTFADSSKLEAAIGFLDQLAPFVKTYGVNAQVSDQQEALRQIQKKMDRLRNDSTDLEKRLRDLNSDLARNKADQVKAASDLQTYVGADNEKKYKYQKQVNKLIDKQGDLEKKIRNTESDLTDTKSAVAKQQLGIDQLARSMEATKGRGG